MSTRKITGFNLRSAGDTKTQFSQHGDVPSGKEHQSLDEPLTTPLLQRYLFYSSSLSASFFVSTMTNSYVRHVRQIGTIIRNLKSLLYQYVVCSCSLQLKTGHTVRSARHGRGGKFFERILFFDPLFESKRDC